MANSMYANDAQASTSGGGGGGGTASASTGITAIMGFKASQAAAKNAKLTAEYNAKIRENERILLQRQARDEQERLREGSEKLVSAQRVAAAKSGVVVGTGSNLLALRDTFMKTEEDAIAIRYASSIQEQTKTTQAAMSRAVGKTRSSAIKTQAYANLIESGSKAATLMG